MQDAHWSLNVVPMDSFRLRQLLLCILQLGVVSENALLDLVLSLDKLILRRHILL